MPGPPIQKWYKQTGVSWVAVGYQGAFLHEVGQLPGCAQPALMHGRDSKGTTSWLHHPKKPAGVVRCRSRV